VTLAERPREGIAHEALILRRLTEPLNRRKAANQGAPNEGMYERIGIAHIHRRGWLNDSEEKVITII